MTGVSFRLDFWKLSWKFLVRVFKIKGRPSPLLEPHVLSDWSVSLIRASDRTVLWVFPGLKIKLSHWNQMLHPQNTLEWFVFLGTGGVILPHDKAIFHFLLGLHPSRELRIKHTIPASSNKTWQTREQGGSFNPQDENLGACFLTER